jgi:type II secretory pathway predicted ATPase ExeA/cell division septation protein DedD
MKTWTSHFKLTGDPFGENPADWRYYYGACYGIASLRLERAFEQPRGYVLVTGPAGTGKSTLVRSVLARVPVYSVAVVSAAHRAPASVLEALLHGRAPVDTPFSDTRKRAVLIDLVEHARRQKKPIACVIEDAHLAHVGQLRDLFTAVSLAPDAHQILQLVLVGRPSLITTLEAASLDALRARIATRVQMTPLNSTEVADYLRDRLEAVGAEQVERIFPAVTMRSIAQASRGVIALCEAIARRSLERAAATDCPTVTTEIVEEVATIYSGPPADVRHAAATMLRRLPSALTSGPVAAVVALALTVAAIQVSLVRGPRGTIEAGLAALTGIATTPTVTVATGGDHDELLAQRRKQNMRDTFLAGTPYETEIPPPPRPGSEIPTAPPSGKTLPPGALPPATSSGIKVFTVKPDGTTTVVPNTPTAGRPQPMIPIAPLPPGAPPAEPTPLGAPPASAKPTTATAPAPLPITPPAAKGAAISLQVGAFRELKSAADLRARLQEKFSDVHISTIDSGGEPLYRVRVGHFRTEDESNATKSSLQAAGFASFRVTD